MTLCAKVESNIYLRHPGLSGRQDDIAEESEEERDEDHEEEQRESESFKSYLGNQASYIGKKHGKNS